MKATLIILAIFALTAIASPIYDHAQIRFNVPKGGVDYVETQLVIPSPSAATFSLTGLQVNARISFAYSDVGRTITVAHGYSASNPTEFNQNYTSDGDNVISVGSEYAYCLLNGCIMYFRLYGTCTAQYFDTCGSTISVDFSVAFQKAYTDVFNPASTPYPTLHYGVTSRQESVEASKYHYWEYVSPNATDIVTIDPDFFATTTLMGSTTGYPTADNVGGWVQSANSASHSFSTTQTTHIGVYCEKAVFGSADYTLVIGVGASASLIISGLLMMISLLSALLL